MRRTMRLAGPLRFVLVLALAAGLRIVWATRVGPEEFLQIDGRDYREISEHLAHGQGHTITTARWFEPASLLPPGPRPECDRPPLLPWIGAPLFFLPGRWELWARALMIALGTAPVALLWRLGARIGEPRAGPISALLFAVHPFAIYYSGHWSTETPFLLLILGAVTALAGTRERPAGTRALVTAGIMTALAALARPTGLVLIPLLAATIAVASGASFASRRTLRRVALFLITAIVCLTPWSVRNFVVAGVPTPGTFFGPYNCWLGHNDRVYALYHTAGSPAFADTLRGIYEESSEVVRDFERRGIGELHAMNHEWNQRTRAWVRDHPGRAAELWLRRAFHYFRAAPEKTQISRTVWLAATLYTWPVHLLALLGLALRRRRTPWLLLMPPLAGLLVALPFIFHLRFRHPFLDPYAVLLAGMALAAMGDRLRGKSGRSEGTRVAVGELEVRPGAESGARIVRPAPNRRLRGPVGRPSVLSLAGLPCLSGLLCLCCLLAANAARAVESIVPFDEAGRLVRLTAVQREELRLWPDRFPGFEEARIWRDEQGVERLQVVWREQGELRQERLELAAAEAESLHAAIRAWLAAPIVERPTAGMRTLLLSSTTLTGLGFYSWGVPGASRADGKTAVAIGMLSTGLSFALPYVATLHERVTPGMAQLGIVGITRGIGYGAVLNRAWRGPRTEAETGLEAAAIGSAACGIAGYLWAREARLDAGRAHLIEVGSDLGTLAGIEAALALDLPAHEDERDRSLEYVSALGGAAAGVAGATMRGARSRPTWGDAEVLRTTSALTQGFVLTAWDLGTDNEPTIAAAALAGSIAGAWLGDRWTDRPDFRANQAVLLDLCTIAGGALALGGVYLSDSDSNSWDHHAYTAGATLGALAGYGLAYRAFVDDAVSVDRASADSQGTTPRFSVTPTIGLPGRTGAHPVGVAWTMRF